jgi:hypothetical protein
MKKSHIQEILSPVLGMEKTRIRDPILVQDTGKKSGWYGKGLKGKLGLGYGKNIGVFRG